MGDLLGHNIDVALRDSANKWESNVKKKQFRGARGAADGSSTFSDRIRTRTGALRNSISHFATGSGLRRKRFLVSRGVPYATIQEHGGVVRGNPYLKIPLPIAYRPSGTLDPRFIATNVGGKWLLPGGERSFLLRSKKGNLLAGFNQSGSFVPTHVLKKSVTIPGPSTGHRSRLRFFGTWNRDLVKFRQQRGRRAVKATAEGRRLS